MYLESSLPRGTFTLGQLNAVDKTGKACQEGCAESGAVRQTLRSLPVLFRCSLAILPHPSVSLGASKGSCLPWERNRGGRAGIWGPAVGGGGRGSCWCWGSRICRESPGHGMGELEKVLGARRLDRKVGDAGKGQEDPERRGRRRKCVQSCESSVLRDRGAGGARRAEGSRSGTSSGLWGAERRSDTSPKCVSGARFVTLVCQERRKLLRRQRCPSPLTSQSLGSSPRSSGGRAHG